MIKDNRYFKAAQHNELHFTAYIKNFQINHNRSSNPTIRESSALITATGENT